MAPPDLEPGPDWQDVGLVQYRASSSARAAVESYLEDNHLRPRLIGEADDALLMIEAAARGGFIAFVPRSVARDPVSAGRLKVIAEMGEYHQAIHAVYQDGEAADMARRAVAVLVDHLRAAPD